MAELPAAGHARTGMLLPVIVRNDRSLNQGSPVAPSALKPRYPTAGTSTMSSRTRFSGFAGAEWSVVGGSEAASGHGADFEADGVDRLGKHRRGLDAENAELSNDC